MKKQLPAVRVEETTIEALREQAKEENRSFSNHVDTVLSNHVKKDKPKPFTSKQEYATKNDNI